MCISSKDGLRKYAYSVKCKIMFIFINRYYPHACNNCNVRDMTHCKIRLSLGSAKTQNLSIFYQSNNLSILILMF